MAIGFGLISKSIWHSEKFRALGCPIAKLVYHYLHTNEHRNSAGVYVLKRGYAAYDLDLSLEDYDRAIDRAIDRGLIAYDKKHEIVLIFEFFRFNPATNHKHAAGIRKCIERLPDSEIKEKAIIQYNIHANENRYETITYEGVNGFDTPMHRPIEGVSKGYDTTGTREHGIKKEGSKEPIVVSENDAIEIRSAIDCYNRFASLAGWPVVKKLTAARRASVKARLVDAGGLDGWESAIARASKISGLCGDNDRNWVADFDFFTQQKSFTKLIEGGYDRWGSAKRPASSGYTAERPEDYEGES